MKTAMLGLLAETSVHPGSGRGVGVVDLPVARETATDYPVLVGSSLKGALRDKMKTTAPDEAETCFGNPQEAGNLMVSDGRLLLLPVRSLTGSYRWVTCRHLIERFGRDMARAGLGPKPDVPCVEQGTALTAGSGELFLDERQFSIVNEPDDRLPALAAAIEPMLLHPETRARLPDQIAVLNDNDFAWFGRYGLSIQARNRLEGATKRSESLWFEETLPPDTVMYTLISGRTDDALGALDGLFPDADPYLQAGGNETVGQGWFAVRTRRAHTGGSQ